MAKTSAVQFAQQVRQETAKIIWPTRRETVVTTITVFVMVAFVSIVLFIVDQLIAFSVRWILGLGA